MIRRFSNDRGKLFALNKSNLRILAREYSPRGILWKENYYKDIENDLDSEWLTPIEQRFAKHYPKLADHPWVNKQASSEEGEAFIDWTISQMCRTRFVEEAMKRSLEQSDPLLQLMYKLRPKLFQNEIRRNFFERLKEVYTQPGWKWKAFLLTADVEFVLTDHPVCTTAKNTELGHVILVPLSRKRLIFGGGRESLRKVEHLGVSAINIFLAAWAEKWIYASRRQTLELIVTELLGYGHNNDQAWLNRATKPLFGILKQDISNDPEDIFAVMKDSYKE